MKVEFREDTHEYFVDGVNVPSVTEVLSVLTGSHYGSINPAVLARAAAKGTAVHEACEMIDYGFPPDMVESEIAGYVEGYMAFLRDYKPQWERIEEIVVGEYLGDKFAGRLDRYGYIDGHPAVLDIKTTSNPNRMQYVSLCCQTAAYWLALDHEEHDYPKRYGLYLKPNGDYRLFDCNDFAERLGLFDTALFEDCLLMNWAIRKIQNAKMRKEKDGRGINGV